MLVDDFYRNMVGYVVEERWDSDKGALRRDPIGTAFMVGILSRDVVTHYAVTCKHVIMPSSDTGQFFLRLNRTGDGLFEDVPAPPDSWIRSETSDVAISIFSPNPTTFKFQACPIEQMQRWTQSPPTPGYDVFTLGLFISFPGEQSVQALVRSGRLAREDALVEVTIDRYHETKQMIEAYLIEGNAWPGESGSPVFAYTARHASDVSSTWDSYGEMTGTVTTRYESELLGMLHGHFRVDDDGREVNAGIAIVIPVKKIMETLMNPTLVKYREEKSALAKRPSMTKPLGQSN